ncbi:unnamed protein product, partial [Amoebophrya sp. A25]|eukprot:GSA25T00001683001.1
MKPKGLEVWKEYSISRAHFRGALRAFNALRFLLPDAAMTQRILQIQRKQRSKDDKDVKIQDMPEE